MTSMNQTIRTLLFQCSGLFLLLGALFYITKLSFAPYVFAVGAAGIALCHLTTPVKQMNIRQRRLQMFNVIAGLLMLVASVYMFKHQNEWILCLTIAALLHLYAAFVSPGKK
jgi:glucose uptake protein GlcU